jgi:cytoskeletal protein RodZ
MNTIGETLRRERVRQGLDFQRLSETTKISTRMLQAMEAGDLAKLPGGVFTRSFFKQYAAILELDPSYVDSELQELQSDAVPPIAHLEAHYVPYKPLEPKSNSLTAAAVWVVLALVGSGGVYYLSKNYPFGSTSKQAESASTKTDQSFPLDAKPIVTPASISTAAPPPIGSGSLQVVLNASDTSWVSVTVDGKVLFSGILKPNERREINAAESVKVIAGNAGGLDISLNGKTIEALGPKGQVRTVELTRAGAQVVSRASRPEPLL